MNTFEKPKIYILDQWVIIILVYTIFIKFLNIQDNFKSFCVCVSLKYNNIILEVVLFDKIIMNYYITMERSVKNNRIGIDMRNEHSYFFKSMLMTILHQFFKNSWR